MRAELGLARDRRSSPRYDVLERQLIYVDLRCDNGGIVLNCGEGGIAIQAVAPPPQRPGHELLVFLPDGPQPVVATGDIVWVNDSHQVGIRFTAMPDMARARLAEWFEQTARTHLAAADFTATLHGPPAPQELSTTQEVPPQPKSPLASLLHADPLAEHSIPPQDANQVPSVDDPEPWGGAFTALHERPQGVVVRCRNCGHRNREENRFCGMCGNALAPGRAADPKSVVEKVAINLERAASEVPRDVASEPAHSRHQPSDPEPAAPVVEPARRSDKWWVNEEEENETTIAGPSFLGLSSTGSGEAGGYSYLLEEEEPSHTGVWVLLIVLLAVGGVLYAKWQPIRDYVLTTSDAPSQPTITTENKQNKAADQNKPPDQKEGLPEGDGKSAAGKTDAKSDAAGAAPGRGDKAGSRQQAAKSQHKASANDADEERASAANEERPAKKAAAPQANPGSELVTSGEKYLYGRGAPWSCTQAVIYFSAAAAKQNPQAFSHLGALYATGECVPMDRAVAYAWFRRAYAKEPNNHYFEQNLTMLWREMTPEERQRATGRQ
jgi:hypothetical protein